MIDDKWWRSRCGIRICILLLFRYTILCVVRRGPQLPISRLFRFSLWGDSVGNILVVVPFLSLLIYNICLDIIHLCGYNRPKIGSQKIGLQLRWWTQANMLVKANILDTQTCTALIYISAFTHRPTELNQYYFSLPRTSWSSPNRQFCHSKWRKVEAGARDWNLEESMMAVMVKMAVMVNDDIRKCRMIYGDGSFEGWAGDYVVVFFSVVSADVGVVGVGSVVLGSWHNIN